MSAQGRAPQGRSRVDRTLQEELGRELRSTRRIPQENSEKGETVMTSATLSNEITITRLYDAPVKLVWDAWTDLNHVAQWWGPRGFTITTHSKDLRPGGKWIYTMH